MKNSRHVGLLDFLAITETADIALAVFPGIRAVCIYYLVCRDAVHARVPLHLAQLCGRCLSRRLYHCRAAAGVLRVASTRIRYDGVAPP